MKLLKKTRISVGHLLIIILCLTFYNNALSQTQSFPISGAYYVLSGNNQVSKYKITSNKVIAYYGNQEITSFNLDHKIGAKYYLTNKSTSGFYIVELRKLKSGNYILDVTKPSEVKQKIIISKKAPKTGYNSDKNKQYSSGM